MIPPVISENPESGGDQNTEEILQPPIECYEIGTLIEPFGPTSCTGCKFLKFVICHLSFLSLLINRLA